MNILIVMALVALVCLVVSVRTCPTCGENRWFCLFACVEVSERLDRLEHERVEVVTAFADVNEAIDFVSMAQTVCPEPYFYRCRDGVAEVCRVVRV